MKATRHFLDAFAASAVLVFSAAAIGTGVLSSCATGGNKQASQSDRDDDEVSHRRSRDVKQVIQSFSNNPQTKHTVSKAQAEAESQKLAQVTRDPSKAQQQDFEDLLVTQRMAHKSIGELSATARQIADQRLKKSIDKDLPDEIKVELALGALQNGKIGLTEYLLDQVLDPKNQNMKAKAAAHNIYGVIALRQNRIPEAVVAFKQALKSDGEYKPAQLNLGFLALYGGDIKLAKQMLSAQRGDFIAQAGMLTVERLENDATRADESCAQLLKKDPQHKPTLYNCALFEYQNRRNLEKARGYLSRYLSSNAVASSRLDEKMTRLSARIETERAQVPPKPAAKP